MIDLHFVTPGLAVGARFPAEAAPQLAAEHDISRVVARASSTRAR